MIFAAVATLVLGVLIWVYEGELLWMLAILVPPIWIPVLSPDLLTDQMSAGSTKTITLLAVGLSVLAVLAVFI